MTEEEAKKKRCCGPDGCGSPFFDGYGTRTCIGSACMAWRWDGQANVGPSKDRLPWVEGNERDGYTPVAERRGHCGLAGEP